MMGVVIVSFLINAPALALLAVPIFMSALMGVRFRTNDLKEVSTNIRALKAKTPKLKDAA